MRAPVSIIIPTLNAASELPATLGALAEGLNEGLIREVIISDGGSADGTAPIAEAAGAVLLRAAKGRGAQLAAGGAAARGDWMLFLHSDTQLAAGWAGAVLTHMSDHAGHAAYFRLAFRASGHAPRIVAAWANCRSRALGLPYGDQGLLIRRDLYDAIGGYRRIGLMEDVAIARALKGRIRQLDAYAQTSAARYQAQGWLRRGGRNLITLARFFMGADPARLRTDYDRD